MSKHPAIKKHLCCLFWLVAALLTGCRDYGVEENDAQGDVLSRFDAFGRAWLNLEIPLETNALTRSSFEDGNANEYAVKNVMIVLFRGTGSEDNMTVASTYNFTTWEEMSGTYQISKRLLVNAANIEKQDDIYLLAILNATPNISIGATFGTVKNILSDIITTSDNTNYFVMTNAPLATNNDGTGSVSTLVHLIPSLFYSSEEEAAANPAAQIYVERAAAKVTVELDDDIPTINNTLPEGNNASYNDYYVKGNPNLVFTDRHLADYSIYNHHTEGYLVRHFDNNWLPLHRASTSDYRFIETNALPYASPSRYRTYWAEDADYDEDMTNNGAKDWTAIGTSDYCAENTMDLTHMDIQNSTLVLVRLNLNNYTSFYTTSVTGSDIIYQLPKNPQEEEGTSAHESFARNASSLAARQQAPQLDDHYYVSSARTIDEYLREWLMQTNSAAHQWVETYAAGDPHRIKIDLTNSDGSRNCGPKDGGQAVVHCTQNARAANTAGATAFTNLSLDTYFAQNITVNFYDDGYCYYLLPIMHFGDTQTPWQSAGTMAGSSAAHAYGTNGTNNAAYLGRYGVVRNNWYNIAITGVTHVGGCNIAQLFDKIKDQADDTVEQLLNATLNISPWTTNNTILTPPTP